MASDHVRSTAAPNGRVAFSSDGHFPGRQAEGSLRPEVSETQHLPSKARNVLICGLFVPDSAVRVFVVFMNV